MTNTVVDLALRPVVDIRLYTLVRADFDSVFGQFFTNNVVFTDVYLTNSSTRQQVVTRVASAPDIVFAAADLGVTANGLPVLYARAATFVNNSGINGAVGRLTTAGPGVVNGPRLLTFSRIGPYFRNTDGGSEFNANVLPVTSGFFDGFTNAPIVFPSGISVQQLEQAVTLNRVNLVHGGCREVNSLFDRSYDFGEHSRLAFSNCWRSCKPRL